MINQVIESLKNKHEVIAVIDLSTWSDDYNASKEWLTEQCLSLYRQTFKNQQRIIFVHTKDYYVNDRVSGIILRNLQVILNEVDISTFFVTVVSTSPTIVEEMASLQSINNDSVALSYIGATGEFQRNILSNFPTSRKEEYQYGSANPIKVSLTELTDREQFLLTESKMFCMYPWVHLHAWPTGQAFFCCYSEPVGQIGDCRTSSLEEIWNSPKAQQIRRGMLSEQPSAACRKCYEMEQSGFFSGRQSANKHHGHHVVNVAQTTEQGKFDKFELSYWDIRFSNLCNLSCRSCGHIFSSSWFQDQQQLVENLFIKSYHDVADSTWPNISTVKEYINLPENIKQECSQIHGIRVPEELVEKKNKFNGPLIYAGRWETDMWEQLEPHLDYVEQIYFAGGEPLLMEEHYNILEELVKRERFDVRLIYNTNFTHTQLKGRSVFDYWKLFKSVAVGASLDAEGARGEYIRRGTQWSTILENRYLMLEKCPEIDFYISPTLSILNALHLPDFHRSWVEKGLIQPQDLNVNILQGPDDYRIDIATPAYKEKIRKKYLEHIEWLSPLDTLERATVGFKSALNFLDNDNSHLLNNFWSRTTMLDKIRKENILDFLPELEELK